MRALQMIFDFDMCCIEPGWNSKKAVIVVSFALASVLLIILTLHFGTAHVDNVHYYKTETIDGIVYSCNSSNLECSYLWDNSVVLNCISPNITIDDFDSCRPFESMCSVTVDKLTGSCYNFTQYTKKNVHMGDTQGDIVLLVPIAAFIFLVFLLSQVVICCNRCEEQAEAEAEAKAKAKAEAKAKANTVDEDETGSLTTNA